MAALLRVGDGDSHPGSANTAMREPSRQWAHFPNCPRLARAHEIPVRQQEDAASAALDSPAIAARATTALGVRNFPCSLHFQRAAAEYWAGELFGEVGAGTVRHTDQRHETVPFGDLEPQLQGKEARTAE
jgi:hypothetical protein